MKWFQHRIGLLTFIALVCSVSVLAAQENTPITAAGSGIVTPVFEALAAASTSPVTLETTVTGTSGGFERLCSGLVDVTVANRTITANENNACTTNNVQYVEQLIAHNVLAFVASPDATYNQCLSNADLNLIFPPSAEGQTTDWAQVGTGNASLPLSVVVPAANTSTFTVLDNFIQGDGIRADATSVENDEAVIAAVAGEPGAVGVVSLNAAMEAGDAVKILQLNSNEVVGCTSPSAENIEARSYTAAESYYAYANQVSLDKTELKDLFLFINSDQAAPVIQEHGLSAPSAGVTATNLASLEGTGEAAPFSSDSTSFQIPFDVSGTVAVAGSASGRDYLSSLTSQFQSIYSTVTVDLKTEGQPEGVRRLCNGEIDIVVVEQPLTDEQIQNCEANNISTLPISLGSQAVVLVANGNSPYLACLTTDQLSTIWSASSGGSITTWNQVDSSFPEQAMTLFQPNAGDPTSDLLLIRVTGIDTPNRQDTEFHDDPLYRAAATANVDGALTYMSWPEYQQVLANNQERIQLVGVDSGDGCVSPSVETIRDGSYPLVRPIQLLVKEASLAKPEVQSVLWYLASDENFPLLEGAGLTGVSFGDLPGLRQTLERAFLQAQQVVETTPEPGAEATAEATAEASEEMTAEATAEATSEATAEATPAS
jgi:phosphate transport system substrate-binding protein